MPLAMRLSRLAFDWKRRTIVFLPAPGATSPGAGLRSAVAAASKPPARREDRSPRVRRSAPWIARAKRAAIPIMCAAQRSGAAALGDEVAPEPTSNDLFASIVDHGEESLLAGAYFDR